MEHVNTPTLNATVAAVLLSAVGAMLSAPVAAADAWLSIREGQPIHLGSGCVHTGEWKTSMPTCPEPTLVHENGRAMIVFTLDDAALFNFDQVKLSDRARTNLDALVASVDKADKIERISVTGHADRNGPPRYDKRLAQRRAEAVKDYLVSKGILASRIQASSDDTAPPFVTCPNIQSERARIRCLAPNRRVDIEAQLADDAIVDPATLVPLTSSERRLQYLWALHRTTVAPVHACCVL